MYPIDDIKRSTSIEKSPAHCNATQSWKIQRFALLQKVEIDNSGMLLHSIVNIDVLAFNTNSDVGKYL